MATVQRLQPQCDPAVVTDKCFCAAQSASHHFLKASLQLQPPESTMPELIGSHALPSPFCLRLSPKAAPPVNVSDKYWCLARCLSHYSCGKFLLYEILAAGALTMVLKSAEPLRGPTATQHNKTTGDPLIPLSARSDVVPRHRRLSFFQFEFAFLAFCHFVSNLLLITQFQSSIFVSRAAD